MLIPLSVFAFWINNIGFIGSTIILIASILFTLQSLKLVKNNSDKEAKKLMFYSFAYLLVFLFSLFL
jgi:heme O synthase-like polyprenyltransferase